MTRAEDKYDLQLVNTKTDKPIQQQPWYRERFRSRHLKELPGDRSYPNLVGSQWTFVKDGLDDFRDGYPPDPENGGIIKPVGGGVAPQLNSYQRAPKQQVKPRLSKHQVLYSKALPGQERRRDYLDSLIQGLKDHPLALYSHIEESVPPDMFEDLIDALDREMMLGETVTDEEYNQAQQIQQQQNQQQQQQQSQQQLHHWSQLNSSEQETYGQGIAGVYESQVVPQTAASDSSGGLNTGRRGREAEGQVDGVDQEGGINPQDVSGNIDLRSAEPGDLLSRHLFDDDGGMGSNLYGNRGSSNGYRWLPSGPPPAAVSRQQQQQQQLQLHQQQSAGATSGGGGGTAAGGSAALTPAEDAHIQKVTENFCQWVAELGGDSNNIDESTVMGLFSGGYESKPALSAPIHVVELTNVPPELRMNSAAPGHSRMSSSEGGGHGSESDSKLLNAGYVHTKPTKAVRYGAWYLKPKQWKVLKPGEDISDPNHKEGVFSEAKRRSVALDSELSSMHGAKEFIKFMRHKGNPVPDFLSRVASMQQEDTADTHMHNNQPHHPSQQHQQTKNPNTGGKPPLPHYSTPTRNTNRTGGTVPTPSIDSKSTK
ncbi:uncharacterized protein LOC142345800 isoform X2 [Convolutriloba macropyga]|uniref:uncharacterized protein LOC142345800 isoform X2 n=1 Tax=Convolutriloba macropyga TaxID=536237 RepID=UPI003F527AEB